MENEVNSSRQRAATVADYQNRINAAVRFIQQHASQNLDIATIAATANFSPFHFHRIFVAYVGETVGEYLKRVRMIKAAGLLASEASVAEVALESGYETPSAFIQVFKKTYGLTPQAFKQTRQITQERYPVKSVAFPAVRPPRTVEVRELPTWPLLYVRKKGLIHDNYTQVADEGFRILYRFLRAHQATDQVVHRLGIIPDMELLSPENCRFDACVTLREPTRLVPEGEIQSGRIEAGKWAVFGHKGAYDTLWQTWYWIYRHWYPTSGFEFREAAPFEIYLNANQAAAPSDLLTDIYIPIE